MSDDTVENLHPKTDADVIAQAKSRFKIVEDSESQSRKEALDDLKFRAGEQWPDDVKTQRNNDGRPCLTINKLPQFIRQITNDQRQNRPSIKVYPVDSKADQDTAEVMQGMIKHIEYNSAADLAYDTAFDAAVTMGRGFFRIVTDYADPMSFNQEILIKMIENAFSVYFDPFSVQPDGSDANYALIVEDLSKDTFKETYPNAVLSAMQDWSGIGSGNKGWITTDTCRVAEYFTKELKKKKIILLTNGDVIDANGIDLDNPPDFGFEDDAKTVPIEIKDMRTTDMPVIKWYKITATEILDQAEWAGDHIPVIPVYGDKYNVDGKKVFEGIVRYAKDPQRMYNYWSSNETEVIALAPRAPWIGAAGQFEGFEAKWRDANRRNMPYLEFNQNDSNGAPAPPPTRNIQEPPVQGITQAKQFSDNDLKATTGIYDAPLGAPGPETSGIAIQRRTTQSQTSNFHFTDNFTRSLRHGGRIILNLIPVVYDTPQAQRILKPDGTVQMVKINQVFQEASGERKMHHMGVGKYDCVVETGPSYATKRMEAAASIEKVLKAYPQLMQVAGDILISNMDWPGATELADRLKKTIPPNLLDDKENPQPIPPQVKAQMDQMSQMIQQLSQSLNTANSVIENKKLELASKERIELAKLQASLETTLFKEGVSQSQFQLEHQTDVLQRRQAMLAAMQPLSPDQNLAPGSQSVAPGMNQKLPIGGPSPS